MRLFLRLLFPLAAALAIVLAAQHATAAAPTSWSVPLNISASTGSSEKPAVATDYAGNVHVVWNEFADGNRYIFYRMWNGSAWTEAEAVQLGYVQKGALAVNAANDLHLVYITPDNRGPYLTVRSAETGSWSTPVNIAQDQFATHLAGRPNITFSSSGIPHVVWDAYSLANRNYSIFYAAAIDAAGSSWDLPELVAANGQTGEIAFDAAGRLHFTWRTTTDYRSFYRYLDANGWGTATALSTGMSSGAMLETDVYGNVHLLWHNDVTGESNYRIWHPVDGWSPIETVTAICGAAYDFGIDSATDVHVVSNCADDISYVRRVAGSWESRVNISNNSTRSAFPALALAIDVSLRVYVVWRENDVPNQTLDIFFAAWEDAPGGPDLDPLILVPGITGSKLENDPDQNGSYHEVWPNVSELIGDLDDDSLLVLRLAANGGDPFQDTPPYTTVRVGDIIRTESVPIFDDFDAYGTTIAYLTRPGSGYVEGENFFVCPYDWRKDIGEIAGGALDKTLERCIDDALVLNPDATQVDIIAHSMGGLVARHYLSDPDAAAKVDQLVTLGTPYLGAPKIALSLIDEQCFVLVKICWSHPPTLKELAKNMPSAYQISPGDAYFQVYPFGYIRRDRDANGDVIFDGYLDADASYELLGQYNVPLAEAARIFNADLGGWSNGGTNGARVYVIVGYGSNAIGTIVEYEKSPWWNLGQTEIVYATEPTNGDGTVPLRSATMRNPEGADLSGGVPTFYYELGHTDLPTDLAVLHFVSVLFASEDEGVKTADSHQAFAPIIAVPEDETGVGSEEPIANSGAAEDGLRAAPRIEPRPLTGRFLTFYGPVDVLITDSFGNRAGVVTPEGLIAVQIPGASFHRLSSTTSVFLPDTDTYQIELYGNADAASDVRIQHILDDQLTETVLYDDLPLTPDSVATLAYDPDQTTPEAFILDQDGDGVYEAQFAHTTVLDPTESQDRVPPLSSVSIEGDQTLQGWYTGTVTITLTAEDDVSGTGVAKIEYSTDGGRTVRSYDGPFTVDARRVQVLLVKATDVAGNEEAPLQAVAIGPFQTFVPVSPRP